MKSLVINAGSSSIKFQVFDEENSLISGRCDAIGLLNSFILLKESGEKKKIICELKNHEEAFKELYKILQERNLIENIGLVVHRVVHGGEEFSKATLMDKEKIERLKELIPLAPLHNPANILGVELMIKIFPEVPHVAVFDTAYHSTISEVAYLYGVPYSWYKEHKIRRYGFHGSSHQYVINEAMKLLNNFDAKIISCHLGNGCSICATKSGKSVNTSMGFTPLEGVVMGTRSGTIDPAIITYMMNLKGFNPNEIEKILNKDSGLLGLSQISSDMRVLEEVMNSDERAKRAINVFCNRIVQIIGSYIAELNGVDAIVFTGGIGENEFLIREGILKHFDFLNLKYSKEKNEKSLIDISEDDSSVKILIIPTNEELQMIRVAKPIIENN